MGGVFSENTFFPALAEALRHTTASLVPGKYKFGEHVSYEDLLEFALDNPTSAARRAQAKAQGEDSDEVRIMQKVLSHEVSLYVRFYTRLYVHSDDILTIAS